MKTRNIFHILIIASLLLVCFCQIRSINRNNVAYSGNAYTIINNNIPYFTEDDITSNAFESYAPLDYLGRCGECVASIGVETMPTEERSSISSVTPTAWHSVEYKIVDGGNLYNRCHLIGHQLTGENANENNLITGTRYMNIEGMLPFENMVADYVRETGNHVMYRETPYFEGNNLLANGVFLEGYSVEDHGEGISFNVFCHNVQPGISIDYSDGSSAFDDDYRGKLSVPIEDASYILNTKSKKFHKTDCKGAQDIAESNRATLAGSREDAVALGYSPCNTCDP